MRKKKIAARFGMVELGVVLSAIVFFAYFKIVFPMLPQDVDSLLGVLPYVMGAGAVMALAGLALSCMLIIRFIQDATNRRPLNVLSLLFGIAGVAIFTFSLFVIAFVTTAFVVGTSNLPN